MKHNAATFNRVKSNQVIFAKKTCFLVMIFSVKFHYQWMNQVSITQEKDKFFHKETVKKFALAPDTFLKIDPVYQ